MFEEAAARLLSLSPHALRGAAERTLLQRNGVRGRSTRRHERTLSYSDSIGFRQRSCSVASYEVTRTSTDIPAKAFVLPM